MYGDQLLDRLGVKFLVLLHFTSKDLRHNRFPCGADERHICPRGKQGCAVKFHFSKSEQNVLP